MTDQLTRQPFMNLLKSIIANQTANKVGYSIAIDGEWGCGKTWVVNELENQLQNDYLVFHYNAWENDFYDEPLIALLSILIDQLEFINKLEEKTKKINAKLITASLSVFKIIAKSIVCNTIKNKTGIEFKDFTDAFKNLKQATSKNSKTKQTVDTFFPLKKGIADIKKELQTLSEQTPIILVIDELDRCLPEYAIKVLERLHHICNKTQIITIMAIEKNQIVDSICKVFGKQLDGVQKSIFVNRYLQKFIDITIPLNKGKIKDDDLSLFNGLEKQFEPYRDLCDSHFLCDFYNNILSFFPKREQEKILQTVELVHTMTIKQGTKLENYSYQLLCLEILYGIRKCMFNNSFDYECKNKYNTNEFSLKLNIISKDILYTQYQEKLMNYTNTSANSVMNQNNEILYICIENPKQLLLNYFLPNLTYTSADGFTHYVFEIQEEKAFLEVFIKTLEFTE